MIYELFYYLWYMKNDMKPTRITYDLPKSGKFNEEDWVLMPDGREGKAQLGNFIKMMILYDSEMDDGILDYFGTNFSLLYRMLKDIDWSTCVVQGFGSKKEYLCKKLGITNGGYEHHLRNYLKLNLMVRVSKGEYMVNPCKLYAGESADQRNRMMEYEHYKMEQKKKGADDEV